MTDSELGPDARERYARHLALDGVGVAGQRALLEASVLVVGAGGLGSPVIQYLTAAGIGRLGIVDDDVVERSNLNRQVLHGEADLGRPKVASAADFVTAYRPDATVEPQETRLTPGNAADLVGAYDLVVDASDNLPTRYLINDACTLAAVPFVHAAVYRFEGHVTTFTGDGPCYRCLFPTAPPPADRPDCATDGLLGVVPGTLGSLEATEAIKLLVGAGEGLDGRLLHYDALAMETEVVPFEADPSCPVCGPEPAIADVSAVAYTGDCSLPEG